MIILSLFIKERSFIYSCFTMCEFGDGYGVIAIESKQECLIFQNHTEASL